MTESDTTLRALFWDVDGTLAETERDGHRVAFNRAFEAVGLPWRWDVSRYGELLSVAGGRERLIADLETRGDAPTDRDEREALAAELHRKKNDFYAEIVNDLELDLREGVTELMDECMQRGLPMAVTTTTSRSNLDALMRVHFRAGWKQRFAAIINGEDVAEKKPHPEVYQKALKQVGVAPASVVAIEDSPDGVAAARRAGVAVIVTRSVYFSHAPVDGAAAVGPGLHTREGWEPGPPAGKGDHVRLDDIAHWHAQFHDNPSPKPADAKPASL